MSQNRYVAKPYLTPVSGGSGDGIRHFTPSLQERQAADAFLRQRPISPSMQPIVNRAVAHFDDVQRFYVQEARTEGEGSGIWNSAGWIVANAIALAAHPDD